MLDTSCRWCRPLLRTESVFKCTKSHGTHNIRSTSRTTNPRQHNTTTQHICILNTTIHIYLARSLLEGNGDFTELECDDEDVAVKKPNRRRRSTTWIIIATFNDEREAKEHMSAANFNYHNSI